MKPSPAPRQLSFQARVERISPTMEYFAFTVPLKTSQALGTRGPVPVSARLNDRVTFLVSLAPIGGGRHWLRLNAKARLAAGIKEGDLVRVQITVLDQATLPADLTDALRAAGVLDKFKAMSVGTQNFLIKKMDAAAKPETRAKRINEAVDVARQRKK